MLKFQSFILKFHLSLPEIIQFYRKLKNSIIVENIERGFLIIQLLKEVIKLHYCLGFSLDSVSNFKTFPDIKEIRHL